jgi:ankyrin repeat protein
MKAVEPIKFREETFLTDLVAWVRAGGDAPSYRRSSETLLHIAAEFCDGEAIRFLVGVSVDVEAPDDHGWTALHGAVDSEFGCETQTGVETQLAAVRALLECGANPLTRTHAGETPRSVAAVYGENALAKYDQLVASCSSAGSASK